MMSAGEGGGQDFDLNLAPIIDCFTVLITYLLVSASFISLCVFDVGVAATGEAPPGEAPKEPPYSLMMVVQASLGVQLKLTGGPSSINVTIDVPPKGAALDPGAFVAKLRDIQKKYPTIKEPTISGEPTVKYRDVMRAVESLKSVYPKVFVGG